MYSPSGSKRFQLKRNRAYGGGGGLLGVQACVHRGSASLFALRNAAGERVTWLRSDWVSESVREFRFFCSFIYSYLFIHVFIFFPCQRPIRAFGLEVKPAGHVVPPAPGLKEERPVTAASVTTESCMDQPRRDGKKRQ